MKIISLLENTTRREDMLTEHGLSLYIETDTHKILFDMGQTDAFYENAKTLGVDISAVDFAVVSHGHYDHGGGLAKFLEVNSHAPVYIMRDAFLPHYNAKGKYIGLITTHFAFSPTFSICRYCSWKNVSGTSISHSCSVSPQESISARGSRLLQE